jgi:hypothetical protein
VGAVALLGFLVAVPQDPPYAAAQEAEVVRPGERPPAGSRRVLGGHSFISSQLVRDPFATTHFDNRTGAGVAEGQGPRYDLMGTITGQRDYTLSALFSAFEFQYAVQPWLAVRVGGNGTLFAATSPESVVAIGASTGYEGALGATIGTNVGERFRVAALLDYAYGRHDFLDVIGGVGRSIASGQLAGNFIQTSTGPTVIPAVSAAWALHEAVGLVGSVQLRHEMEEGPLVDNGNNLLLPGVLLDLDLVPLLRFPLGVLVGYRLTQPIGDASELRSHALDTGLFYTGNRNLDLGLQLALRRFPARAEADFDAALGMFVMRYFWR